MLYLSIHVVGVVICLIHVLLRGHRQPESRIAWITIVLTLPYGGVVLYVIFGRTNIGNARVARLRQAFGALPRPDVAAGWTAPDNVPELDRGHAGLFRVGTSISGYLPVGGNRAELMRDSDATIDAMIADIDAAQAHVHLLFYIWLPDRNGTRIAEALQRAARRGVVCRAMVDDLGSRTLVGSALWRNMASSGVRVATALPIGNPLARVLTGRIDLRNHRKILVVDNNITYCGSQNCADPAFLPKAKYGPWVDAVMRFEGPVVRQNQHLFASDWMGNGGDDISDLLAEPMAAAQPGFTAQVVGTGPTLRSAAMPELFETLIYAATRELFITTPYYVPDAALQAALRAAGNRGVDTTIIFPARNDDFAVGATSRSYYRSLLEAGVKIHEYLPGLLHTKSLTMDGEVTLIGSANMDRRSFDLNYENNILLQDRVTTAAMRTRQAQYLAQSRAVTLDEVDRWSAATRLWQNAVAIVGPVL